jgi:Flp pilus assembly protein TadG
MKNELARDGRGNVAVLTGLVALVLFGSTGVAIDATRAWMMRSRLATSLDAAAIAVARGYSAGMDTRPGSTLARQACQVFWANFGVSATTNPCAADNPPPARGFLQATSTSPTISVSGQDVLTLTARASLGRTITRLFRNDEISTTAASAAIRTISSLEIALALDVTSSMYPTARNNYNDKIGALRTAAGNFVRSIYGNNETRENTWISVVPYTTHVNIGPSRTAMITSASLAQFSPNGIDLIDSRGNRVRWGGCVEARFQTTTDPMTGATTTGDLVDRPPSELPYVAYFNPSTLDTPTTPNTNPETRYRRTYRGTTYYQPGDNEWATRTVSAARAINEWALNQGTSRPGAAAVTGQQPLEDRYYITGPNLGCLNESRYYIQPLTAERSTILSRIDGLLADPWGYHYWYLDNSSITYGGTIVHLGLHAAWTTISPRWQGLWGNSHLPLNTDEAGQKVIVLMTDGANDIMGDVGRGAPGNCTDTTVISGRRPYGCRGDPSGFSWSSVYSTTDTAYSSYRRQSQWTATLGSGITSEALAEAELNNRLTRLCTNIKNSRVHIYTVGFALDGLSVNPTTVRNLLRNCATASTDYFEAANAAALNAAFQEIANRVGRVRLVR